MPNNDPYQWDKMLRDSDREFANFDRDFNDFDRKFNRHMKLVKRSFWVLPLAFVVLALVGSGVYYVALKQSERTVTFKVLGKDSVTVSSGSGDNLEVHNEYRVYTDQGTFKVTDTLIYTRFNSADTYGQLREGHTYTCKAAGWRFGLFSWFPNLINCKEGV